MCGLGEMAAWLPQASGFAGYATRFCDPCLGFALGWTYWFKYIIVTPNQLTASALVIQEWKTADEVNPGVWVTVFMIAIISINYFGVRFFGEFEFWLSSIKVVVIVGLILLCFLLTVGAGPMPATGFKYYNDPGAFAPYIDTGNAGKFYGFWSSFVNAVFAYLGTELVGVTVGEAQNPRKTIPRAIKLTFYRIIFFYVLSVFFVGMLVPYNDPKLLTANKLATKQPGASASPFVVAIKNANIPHLPGILNACILLFTFSAANSDLYIASRTIYGLAEQGHAPRILAYTDKRGVPVAALALSSCFCLLALMNVSNPGVQSARTCGISNGTFSGRCFTLLASFKNLRLTFYPPLGCRRRKDRFRVFCEPRLDLWSLDLDLDTSHAHLLCESTKSSRHHKRHDAVRCSIRADRVVLCALLLLFDRLDEEFQRLYIRERLRELCTSKQTPRSPLRVTNCLVGLQKLHHGLPRHSLVFDVSWLLPFNLITFPFHPMTQIPIVIQYRSKLT
jgi:amino acid transporter